MKKVLSFLLSILMVATVFQGLTATAFANEWRDTERPNDSEHSYLDVICSGQRHTIYYRGECDYDFIPTGMSYDFDSNTLHLDNCNEPDLIISTGEMGNSFTISVEGNNYIRAITANADKHTNSINITGNGYLHINEDLAFDSVPVQLDANYSDSIIRIDDSVKLSVLSNDDSISVNNSNVDNPIICEDYLECVSKYSEETKESVMVDASVVEMRTFMPVIDSDNYAAYYWDEYKEEVVLCQYDICDIIIDGKELKLASYTQDDMGNPVYVSRENVDFSQENEIEAYALTYNTSKPLFESDDTGEQYAISAYSFTDGSNPDAATEYYWDIYKVIDIEKLNRIFYPVALQLTEEPTGYSPLTRIETTTVSYIAGNYKNYTEGEIVPDKPSLTASVRGSDCVYRDGDAIAIEKGKVALIDISVRDELGNPMIPYWHSDDMADLGFELKSEPVVIDDIYYLSIYNNNVKEFTTGTLTIDAFYHESLEQPDFDSATAEPDATFTLLIDSIDEYEGCIIVGEEEGIYREGQVIPVRPGEALGINVWMLSADFYNQDLIPYLDLNAFDGTGFTCSEEMTDNWYGFLLDPCDLPVGSEITVPCYLFRYSDIEDHGGNPYDAPVLYTFNMTFKVMDKCTDLHDYKETYNIPVSCESRGYTFYTCTKCGEQARHEFRPLEHKLDESTVVVIEKPTCNSMGLKEGVCTVCGNKVQVSINPLPHGAEREVRTNVIPATCTTDGSYDVTYYCTVCNEGLRGDHVIVKATGHKYDAGKVTKQPTCTATGVKTYTCTVCGEKKTEAIAKKAHTYKNYVTKATTSANGSIVNKCSVCGTKKSTSTIYKVSSVALSTYSTYYNGKVKTPTVTVKDSKGKTLKKGTDYDVTYASGRKNVGRYAVTIKLKGNYSGTKTLYFNIIPKGTSISKVTAKSKGFTVSWATQKTQTTGYQIQYSTSSKFSNAKTITMSKNTYSAKSITKLSGNKKYYVRIRTYKVTKFGGKNYNIYSPWSSAKSVTTKK